MSEIVLRHNGIFEWNLASQRSNEIISACLLKNWDSYTNEGGGETVIGRCTYVSKNEDLYNEILNVYSKCLEEYCFENSLEFNNKNLDSGSWLVREYLQGTTMSLHSDGYAYVKENGEFTPPELTILFYLNDDYEGGEIIFPEDNLKIKPKADSVIIFPSKKVHGVLELISGKRYMTQTYVLPKEYSTYDV